MFRFQPVAFLWVATYGHVDAFVPPACRNPTRIDSSLWYLDPSDLPMSTYGGLVVYGNATTAIAPLQPPREQVIVGEEDLGKLTPKIHSVFQYVHQLLIPQSNLTLSPLN